MKMGLQLYTLRDELAKDFIRTLTQVAKIGYQGVEFAGYGGFSAGELKAVLDQLQLTSLGSHVSVERLESALDEEIQFNQIIGSKYIVCPGLPAEMRNSEKKAKEVIELFKDCGKRLSESGIQFCYHNHSFEFEQNVDDQLLFDYLFKATPEKEMQIELDVCWVQHAGFHSLDYMKKYEGRIPLLHIKDIVHAGTERAETVELGNGEMELLPIIDAAAKMDVQWLIVEQDECSNPPLESVETSFQWLKNNVEQYNL